MACLFGHRPNREEDVSTRIVELATGCGAPGLYGKNQPIKATMRAVVQRVKESSVKTGQETISRIDRGLLVLLGVAREDGPADADFLANKIVNLRIFEDDNGKMNRSLLETGGAMLVVSQFTLLGDCRKGRRPSFVAAADPAKATELYEQFVELVRRYDVRVQTGRFGAVMEVALINDGPVTLILESRI